MLPALTGARFHPHQFQKIHSFTQRPSSSGLGRRGGEPLDSRARFSILTASFQSPVRLEKVGSRGKRGLEDTPHKRMCLGTRRNQCPERPKKLKKKKFLPTLVGDSILPISLLALHLLRSYLTPRQDKY